MQTSLLLFGLFACLLWQGEARNVLRRDAERYTSKYDNFDVDRVLASKRLMRSYANCLLEKGACTAEGRELKVYLPEALQTKCAKCSEKQKKIAGKILAHMVENYPDIWEELLQKYDTDGKFRAEYEGTNLEEDYEDHE